MKRAVIIKKIPLLMAAVLLLPLGTVSAQAGTDALTMMEAYQQTLRSVSRQVLPVVVEVEVVQRVTRRTSRPFRTAVGPTSRRTWCTLPMPWRD